LHLRLGRQPVEIANFSSLLKNHLQPVIAGDGVFAAGRFDARGKRCLVAASLELQKIFVGFALFFKIAIGEQTPFFLNVIFFILFLNVT